MAHNEDSDTDAINITTLKPNENLKKLRTDLKTDPYLRKALAENPASVLDKYGLSVALSAGTIARLSAGRGLTIPPIVGVHLDEHADGHLDPNPHIDQNPHVDLG